ncbi:hypothetical protein [Streptomyces litchfieldiae]|uniref:Uncharacterized protein n=1 Tax=Streptomyces litchfieldiae TaxID=3075543 RepID=A0ABU2N271_9ACTN|nr:hypothetical protein [Streptomyces sp. DSM 44938]MDT0347153.1 hypothetical protein [Streptomyces sp. DSM 44938]
MVARTPAEQALARSFTSGGTRFDISDLVIDHHPNRDVTLTYRLAVVRPGLREERWEVTLPWRDKSFVDVLTSPAPEPDRLSMLVTLVTGLVEEWWDTKGHNRRSAKMGRRLP